MPRLTIGAFALASVCLTTACGAAEPTPAAHADPTPTADRTHEHGEPEPTPDYLAECGGEYTRERLLACLDGARQALADGDRATTMRGVHQACDWSPACHSPGDSHVPLGTARAMHIYLGLCDWCRGGHEEYCGFESLLAAQREDAETLCREDSGQNRCEPLTLMLFYGCGVERDRTRSALLAHRDRFSEALLELYLLEDEVVLPTPPNLESPPEPREAHVHSDSDDPDQEFEYGYVGLPARSSDGASIAVARQRGTAQSPLVMLQILDGDDLGERQSIQIYDRSAAEQWETEAQWRRLRASQWPRWSRAEGLLQRGDYRSLIALPELQGPFLEGQPILLYDQYGTVTLRDPGPGRVRFSGRLHPRVVGLPHDAFERDYEDPCDEPYFESASAWRIDGRHALVRSLVRPPGDECAFEEHWAIVELTP